MSYILRLTEAPGIEPVTLGEAKAQCQIDHDGDDALITRLIKASREYFETMTGRALIEQTWTATFAEWPVIYGVSDDADDYPLSGLVPAQRPISAVDVIKLPIISIDGATADAVAWTAFESVKTARGFRAKLTSTAPTGEIVFTFKAGYGAAAAQVPSDIAHAILMLVATMYENRGAWPVTPAGFAIGQQHCPGFADTMHRYRVMS